MTHELYIKALAALAAIAVSGAAGTFLLMFSFAVAAYKFSAVAKDGGRDGGDAIAKRLLYASDKISTVVYLARRGALALALSALWFFFDALCEKFAPNISGTEEAALYLIIAAFLLWLQFAALDMTAIKYGKNNAGKIMAKYSKLFYTAYILMLPLYYLSVWLNSKITRLLKIKDKVEFESIDVELMLSAKKTDSNSITPYTGKIVKNALKLQEFDVSDVMLPRSKVKYLDLNDTNEELFKFVRQTRYTRYPVCRGNLDECLGILNIQDVFNSGKDENSIDIAALRRETIRVKENEKLESALAKMLKYKIQMAIVEDEFGGVIGVLTLDSALSELVGGMRDEFAVSERDSVKRIGKNKYKVAGLASLYKVEDFLDIDFKTDEASTFGGLITHTLGRFPEAGEQIYFKEQHARVSVDKVGERAVAECTVTIEENEEQNNP